MVLKSKMLGKGARAFLACGLSAAMCLAYTPVVAQAADASSNTIVCDISKGSVTISGDELSYTGSDGTAVTGVSPRGAKIVITGSTKTNTVKVCDWDDSTLDITLKNASIDVSEVATESGVGYQSMCAMYLGGESASWASGRVKVTLEGTNTLTSLDYAGLAVPEGAVVTIDAASTSDTLTATSKKANAGLAAPGIGAPRVNMQAVDAINDDLDEFDCGTVIIDGGTVNASSDSSCGIGTGQYGKNCTLVFNGGVVNAEGYSNSAGIGGGQDGACGTVTITGGVINATGGQNGAGIGGGYHNDGGIINILGGTVNATGGKFAAGIGAGGANQPFNHGHALQITIAGGEVTAHGGMGAAGIGAGYAATGFDKILITGGTINAFGGDAEYTEGEAKQWNMADRKQIVVGTKKSLDGAGAGIGCSGSSWALTNYTSGSKAGTTSESGTATFGDGKIIITGGTINATGGSLKSENYVEGTFDYVEAQGLGNGGYVKGVTETTPYAEVAKSITGGTITENGAITFPVVAKVANVKAKAAKAKTVKVTWSAANGAKKYKVAYKLASSKSWKTVTVNAKKYVATSLKSGKKYNFKVCAVNGAVKGAWSAVKTVKVK